MKPHDHHPRPADTRKYPTCAECGQALIWRPGNKLRPGQWLPVIGR